jgi:HSP20 family molecular chaperone IbpA
MSIQELLSYGIDALEKNPNTAIIGKICNTIVNYSNTEESEWRPMVDISEDKNYIYVVVDIPGVLSSSIELNFFNNKIEISGERVNKNNGNIIKNDINYGKFTREITIPLSITKKESVNYTNELGVLEIKIDKKIEEENKFSIKI